MRMLKEPRRRVRFLRREEADRLIGALPGHMKPIVRFALATGIREVEEQVWLVSFLDYDLGYFDTEKGRVEPAPNPFVPDKVLTMSPE